jgi:hypothetical protein
MVSVSASKDGRARQVARRDAKRESCCARLPTAVARHLGRSGRSTSCSANCSSTARVDGNVAVDLHAAKLPTAAHHLGHTEHTAASQLEDHSHRKEGWSCAHNPRAALRSSALALWLPEDRPWSPFELCVHSVRVLERE